MPPDETTAPSGSARHRDAAFSFVVLNDTHYTGPACRPWLEHVVDSMRAVRPDFCLHCGDITDTGTLADHAAAREILARLGAPVHPQIGNHDYAPGDDRSGYDRTYPGPANYRFVHGGWEFLGLDTTDGVRYRDTTISAATLDWLADELPRIDASAPLVVFTHFPLAEGVRMRPRNAGALLDALRQHNVQAVFTAHFHGHTAAPFRNGTITTRPCCARVAGNLDGTPQKGFVVCTARAGRIEQRFVEVPPLQGPPDLSS